MYLFQKFPSTENTKYYLQESIRFELQVGSKICKFVSLYQSPSQTSDGFEKFADNFELTLGILAECNYHLIAVLGDFKIKSKNWYINDKTATEGSKIEFVTSQYGLHQIINEPTHVLENSSSCIDLICSSIFALKLPSSHCIKIQFPPPDKETLNLLEEKFRNLIFRERLVT